MNKKKDREIAINKIIFICVIIAFICILLFYRQGVRYQDAKNWDTSLHLQFLRSAESFKGIFVGEHAISYPLFHLASAAVTLILQISLEAGASIVLTGTVIATLFLTNSVYKRYLPGKDFYKIFILAVISIIAMPIYLPWFNRIFIGQGGPSVWHNPTHIVAKPFALIVFILFVEIYNNRLEVKDARLSKYIWLISIFLVLSNIAKPSFFLVFIPAMGLIMLWDLFKNRFQTFGVCCRLLLALVPTLALSLMQYMVTFSNPDKGTQIIISPFTEWSNVSPNILLSIILGTLFPISVLFINFKKAINDNMLKLGWATLIMAATQACIFMESGERQGHLNFFWGYYMAQFILFVASIIYFTKMEDEETTHKLAKYTSTAILYGHVVVGIYYVISFLITGNYRVE